MLRLRLCEMTDTVMEELERRITCSRLAQSEEFVFLVLADDGELAHLHLRLCHHALGNGDDAFGQCLTQAVGVDGIVIFHNDTTILYFDIDFEHWDVQVEELLADRFVTDAVLRQHPNLIGVGNSGTEIEVGSDACERIVLVAQGLVDVLTGLSQEVAHGDIADVDAEGQSVDEHTYGLGNLQVRAAATDSTEIDLTVVGVTRDDIACSGQQQVCRGDEG